MSLVISFMQTCVRMTIPILLAATGDVLSEKSGVMNIGLEAMMLLGAFVGFVAALFTGNPWIALFYVALAGLVFGLVHAFFTVTLRCNQIVTALAENMLMLGATSALNRTLFGITELKPNSELLPVIYVPLLSDIPVLGPIFFQQNILVYLTVVMVVVTQVILFHTEAGLKIRTIGEKPEVADTLGIGVYKTRYICILYCSVLASLGGASLTIGSLGYFADDLVAGRGFIALAAVIFGRYSPVGVLLASLLFGVADATQLRLQVMGTGLPYHLFIIFPYFVTLLALFFTREKIAAPRAMGKPYIRGER